MPKKQRTIKDYEWVFRFIGFPIRTLYYHPAELQKPGFSIVLNLAHDYFAGEGHEVIEFMTSKRDEFGGKSPMTCILHGKSFIVTDWLRNRLKS
jgi:hypothetical protein